MIGQLLSHAVGTVSRNFPQAIKCSLGPMCVIGVSLYLGLQGLAQPGNMIGFIVIFLTVFMFAFCWMAVSWHRYVLLEEQPSLFPDLSLQPLLPYLGKLLIVTLVMVGCALVLLILVFVLTSLLGSTLALIFAIPAYLAISAIWFRLAIILPGTAIGRPMTLADGWRATEGMMWTLVGVAIAFAIFENILDFITESLMETSLLFGGIVSFFLYWIVTIMGVSILTSLYGHLIEKRPLTD